MLYFKSNTTKKRKRFSCSKSNISVVELGKLQIPYDLLVHLILPCICLDDMFKFLFASKSIMITLCNSLDYPLENLITHVRSIAIKICVTHDQKKRKQIRKLISRCKYNENMEQFYLVAQNDPHYLNSFAELIRCKNLRVLDFGLIGGSRFTLDGLENLIHLKELVTPWCKSYTTLKIIKKLQLRTLKLGKNCNYITDIGDLPLSIECLEFHTFGNYCHSNINWNQIQNLNLVRFRIEIEQMSVINNILQSGSLINIRHLHVCYSTKKYNTELLKFTNVQHLSSLEYTNFFDQKIRLITVFDNVPSTLQTFTLSGHIIHERTKWHVPLLHTAQIDSLSSCKSLPFDQLNNLIITKSIMNEDLILLQNKGIEYTIVE